jgi:hypothetical protein
VPVTWWIEVGESIIQAAHRVHVRGLHLVEILHEDELRKVKVDGCAGEMSTR